MPLVLKEVNVQMLGLRAVVAVMRQASIQLRKIRNAQQCRYEMHHGPAKPYLPEHGYGVVCFKNHTYYLASPTYLGECPCYFKALFKLLFIHTYMFMMRYGNICIVSAASLRGAIV